MTWVFTTLKSADAKEAGLSQCWNNVKDSGRCFTVVSGIAECWHVKFRHLCIIWRKPMVACKI